MILLIDNYDSFTYNLYQLLAIENPDIKVIRNDKISLVDIEKLKPSHIVLSPGPGRPENAGICVSLIKKFASTIPILGICLGHQAIAMAFGGKIILAGEPVHGKTSLVHHHQTGIYQSLPQPFQAGRYHSLIVENTSLPPELMVEAESEHIIMGIRHKVFPCYGLQFHPESILTPEGYLLLNNFLSIQ